MDQTKPDKAVKARASTGGMFGAALRETFTWMVESGKLPSSYGNEAKFVAICCGERAGPAAVKTVRRWLDGSNCPQRGKWDKAKLGLQRAGVDADRLSRLQELWSRDSQSCSQPSDDGDAGQVKEREYDITPDNPLPKLCAITLDIPDQGCSQNDFIITGELRFHLAPDQVDDHKVTVGVRRAILLPKVVNCYIKSGTLYRPANCNEGAAQVIFSADYNKEHSVLIGDVLNHETLCRVIGNGPSAGEMVEITFLVQVERASDLCVSFVNNLRGGSHTQQKVAEKWISDQVSRTIMENDGSLRISSCSVRWR